MSSPYGQSQDSVKRQMMSFFVPTETTIHWHSEPGLHSSRGPVPQASIVTNNTEVCDKIAISLPYPSTWKYLPSRLPRHYMYYLPFFCILRVCSRMLTTSGIDHSVPYYTVSNQTPKDFTFGDMSTQSGSRRPLPHPPFSTHG